MIKELYLVLACLVVMCVVVQMVKKLDNIKPGIYSLTIVLVTFIYLCGVVYFTAIRGPRTGLGGYRLRIMLPILWVFRERKYLPNAITHFLNILLLVPFGYLVPQIKRLPFWKVLLFGLCFSLLIESGQFVFRFGVFQTDDLIDNTIGGAVGYLFFRILNPGIMKVNRNND